MSGRAAGTASDASGTLGRRHCLAAMLALAAGAVRGQDAAARPPSGKLSELAARAVADVMQGRTVSAGRVHLDIPKLAENGLSVPLVVKVVSPMSAADHVRTLHIIAPANPVPTVARLHFTPRSGEAFLSTRVRLADSQRLLAFAEMSDGSVWSGGAHVVVTLGGCLDPML